MKGIIAGCMLVAVALMGCDFGEDCENEAAMVTLNVGGSSVRIDAYEASRTNATSETAGTGLTMACNYRNALPWNNVTYEDARNACLDAGKRLCSQEEWMAACGAAYPYGATYQAGTCNDGGSSVETSATGSKSGCKSSVGVYDMSGNVAEWVEGGTLMGGGFNQNADAVKCTSAQNMGTTSSSVSQSTGFRCCQDVTSL